MIELAALMGKRGAQRRATFFKSATPPYGHRSKATMGLMKKKKKKNEVCMR